jgi:hypothetical protein
VNIAIRGWRNNVVRAGTVSTGPGFELCRHQSIRANNLLQGRAKKTRQQRG